MVSNGTDNSRACKNQNFLGVTSEQIAVMTAFVEAFERGSRKTYSHTNAIQTACRLFVEVGEHSFQISIYTKIKK